MSKLSPQKAAAILYLIGAILTAGCFSDGSSDITSQLSDVPVTVETEEPEYSADLVLTVIFPDKTEYTSTDNGVTWVTDGKTYYYDDMPAYLTVIHSDPISITGGIPVTMTIHNNNNGSDLLGGGSYVEVLRFDNEEWIIPEYADKTKNYAFTDQMDLIYLSKDYYEDLSLYEPISGRYRLTKEFSIEGSELYGLTAPSVPGGIYIMSAEFNALS